MKTLLGVLMLKNQCDSHKTFKDAHSAIYLFVYALFKVDLHITLQQNPINVNYQN